MEESAKIIRVLSHLYECEKSASDSESIARVRRQALDQLALESISGKLQLKVSELIDCMLESRRSTAVESDEDPSSRMYRMSVCGSQFTDFNERDLMEYFADIDIKKIDICMINGCDRILCGQFGMVAFQSVQTKGYRVLTTLLRTMREGVTLDRIHESLGYPYKNVSPGQMHSAMYDYLARLKDKLPPPTRCRGVWWQVKDSHVYMCDALNTYYIEPHDETGQGLDLVRVMSKNNQFVALPSL